MSDIQTLVDQVLPRLEAIVREETRKVLLGDPAALMRVIGERPVVKREPKKATPKPCPITGILNTGRRFSYLMPEVRTPENLAKYRGAA